MADVVEEKRHAVLGGSAAPTFMRCPGSVHLQSFHPNKSSKYADWGTAAHELADICMKTNADAEEHLNRVFEVSGERYTVDMEMADCVNEYVSYIHSFLDPENDIILSEEEVDIQFITGEAEAVSTSDVIGLTDGGETLVVADLKTGKGVKVDAFDSRNPDKARPASYDPETCIPNWQMVMYGGASLEKYKLIFDGVKRVKMIIIQPRLNWVDVLEVSAEHLRELVDQLSTGAGVAMLDEGQTLVPGEKQCKFCNAKATCPAVKGMVVGYVTGKVTAPSSASAFANVGAETSLPKQIAAEVAQPHDAAEVAEAYRALKLIEDWIKAVRERARELADEGNLPGHKLVLGREGDRKWANDDVALEELTRGGRLKVAEATTAKVISPTQAEKLFKDRPKIWAKIVGTKVGDDQTPIITRSKPSPQIALESDPRPAYQIATEASTFEAVVQSSSENEEAITSSLFD
jgi:hypothetical protein